MKDIEIFDAHCDTASELFERHLPFAKNNLHIDAQRLGEYRSYTQVFAVYIPPEYKDTAMEHTKSVISDFLNKTENCNITICKNYSDYENAKTSVKAILSIEGGESIHSKTDLKELYDMGIRMIAPTWNFKNQLACGISEPEDTGLTLLGKEIIKEMSRLKIILDVSHLSVNSFYQASEIFKMPICASHSCSKELNPHIRNLTDDQFMVIKNSGGVVGINFYPLFLGDDISDIKHHIDHFLSLGGENNIGLGSDFDGIETLPNGIKGCQDMDTVIKSLPYSTELREKIAFRNFLRVFRAYNC